MTSLRYSLANTMLVARVLVSSAVSSNTWGVGGGQVVGSYHQ